MPPPLTNRRSSVPLNKWVMSRNLGFDLFLLFLSVEQVESIAVEIVERSLEFCLLHLEKSSYACDDFSLLVSSHLVLICGVWSFGVSDLSKCMFS
jgi:hypothetical protein